MLNIAGVVILYYPDKNLIDRVKSYLDHLTRLFVLDNSGTTADFLKPFIENKKVVYLHDGSNKGISVRLNQAATLALEEKFDWLLTMDQDSYFPEGSLQQYNDCIKSFVHKDSTAMFGVQFQNEHEKIFPCKPEEVSHLITSGSILNLNLFTKLGGFDEALFIDKVDHEYCLRAALNNFKIIQFQNLFIHHFLGEVVEGKSLKTFKSTRRTLHSPLRMYYIFRNYFYLRRKYRGQFTKIFSEMKNELFNRFKNNFIYGKNKTLLLKYVIKGYLDYKKGRMGKCAKL